MSFTETRTVGFKSVHDRGIALVCFNLVSAETWQRSWQTMKGAAYIYINVLF